MSRIDTADRPCLDQRLAAGERSATRRRCARSRARSRSRTPSSPTSTTKRCSRARAGSKLAAQGRAAAAPALGQHRHQEPGLQRRPLRRGADRAGHRQHHAARHHGRLPRPRPSAPKPERERGRGARDPRRRWIGRASRPRRDHRQPGRRRRASCSRTPPTSCSARSPASAPTVLGPALNHQTHVLAEGARATPSPSSSRTGAHERHGPSALGGATRALWTGADEAKWLGWLGIVDESWRRIVSRLRDFAEEMQGAKASATSSCSAWAVRASDPRSSQRPSASSRACRSCWCSIRPIRRRSRSSRRGSTSRRRCSSCRASPARTLEPNILKALLLRPCISAALGAEEAGARFVAVTDPGSALEKRRRARRLPSHLLRRSRHRRPLLGAVELRHGAGGGDGARRGTLPR